MMTTTSEFQKAAQKARPVFDKIQSLYRQLPPTTCNCRKPGACCAFLPEMTLMEALQWLRVIQQLPDNDRAVLIRKFVEFYLTNPIRHMGCPFLSEGHCGIYEFRTFACRAYGLWSQTTGRERTRQSRDGKRNLAKMWQRLGIELPIEALVAEMDYCDQVAYKSGDVVSDERLMAVLEEIYRLDNELADLQTRFETEYHSDFSFLVTSLVLNPKKAVLGKMAVIKELSLSGTDHRLEKLLSQIKPDNLNAVDWRKDGLCHPSLQGPALNSPPGEIKLGTLGSGIVIRRRLIYARSGRNPQKAGSLQFEIVHRRESFFWRSFHRPF